jgi:hypothetical protein
MTLAAVALQWADAMTFAVIVSAGNDLSGEVSPLPGAIGVGPTLLVKALLMGAVAVASYRRMVWSRALVAWTAAFGALGFLTNTAFLAGWLG